VLKEDKLMKECTFQPNKDKEKNNVIKKYAFHSPSELFFIERHIDFLCFMLSVNMPFYKK
jgi:hypothetical protein